MKRLHRTLIVAIATFAVAITARAEVSEIRVPLGAGGFGFLPLHVMKQHRLIEDEANRRGVALKVNLFGLLVENGVFRLLEQRTVVRWGMKQS